MRYHSKISLFLFVIILTSFIQPVQASAVDTGIQVISKGIEAFLEYRTEKNLENTFGVNYGNTSEVKGITPVGRIIYMISAAEQHPLKAKWVRDQFSSDVVWYYVAVFYISLITAGLSILQKYAPELVASWANRFKGHDDFFDYSVWFKTIGKLAILPIVVLPIIEGLFELEQAISSGLVINALEFLKVTPKAMEIAYLESKIYVLCGSFFALRLEFINQFTAHIMKIILMYAVAWGFSEYFAELFTEWFLSALSMRPLIMWYSSMAVEHIARKKASITDIFIDPAQTDMNIVLWLSFFTAVGMLLWPVFKLICKVISDYLSSAVSNALDISYMINRVKRIK